MERVELLNGQQGPLAEDFVCSDVELKLFSQKNLIKVAAVQNVRTSDELTEAFRERASI